MRRIAIGAALLCAGCEEYEFGPELVAWNVEDEVEVPSEGGLVLETWVDFVDADADLRDATVVHTNPDGTQVRYEGCRIPPPDSALPCEAELALDTSARDFEKVTAGTIFLSFAPLRPWFGEHLIEAWLYDEAGFESNHATTVIQVPPPGPLRIR